MPDSRGSYGSDTREQRGSVPSSLRGYTERPAREERVYRDDEQLRRGAVSMNNPYLQGESRGLSASRNHTRREQHTPYSGGVVSAQANLNRRRRKQGDRVRTVIGAIVGVLVLLAVGWFAWTHRPVEVFVNGSRRSVTINTALASIVADDGNPYTPGDYVSVGGNVLEAGKGAPFSATVDDRQLPVEEVESYRVQGGEKISFGAGSDITEEYTAESVEIAPKLVSDGNWGAIVYVAQWGVPGIQETRRGKESGETATVMAREVQDCIIGNINVEPADGKKLVALTFDDGPSDYTQRYLDILKEHGAKATFFNLGENMDSYPDLAKKIVDEGHELMSHTYHHYQLSTLTEETLRDEMNSTFQLVRNAGNTTTVFRPPYGDYSMGTWLRSGGVASAYVLWNVDTLDWALPGVGSIVETASAAGNGEVILMHDGGGNRDQDLEALPQIIDNLHEAGYEFVTITELMQSDPRIPDDIASGNATMPADAVWPTEMA